ncbi:MAG: homocysteine S-methyltransferase family protein [Clostridia bacterium]|nr:homocysteine S-methyltransferase family protein [Clostridia bacterium]
MKFSEVFGKKLLFCDGAMGTMLQSLGLPVGKRADYWSVEQPEKVKSVHLAYLEAGCNIITANTFSAAVGGDYSTEEIAKSGVRIAKEAVAQSGKEALVALDMTATGELLEPLGELTFDKAYEGFAKAVKAGEAAGADFVLVETMTDTAEIKAAVLAVKENSSLPVVVTFTVDENGRLMTGADIVTAAALIESLGADGVGINCGFGPDKMLEFAPELLSFTKLPVLINSNAGMPVVIDGVASYDVKPDSFAASAKKLVEMGCSAVGGCCGTTPAHLEAVVNLCKDISLNRPDVSDRKSFVSSRAKTVFFNDKTVLIGERINPTGKPKLKAALKENNLEYLCTEAVNQENAGADILDVNVGISEIDEVRVLEAAVKKVSQVTDLPLQIDTSNTTALEKALRAYVGKPLINSVNGSEESLNTVLPLAAKYGAMVVGLTLDEKGIPETAEGRIQIAKRIISRAAEYGIDKSDIIIDPLTMTISTSDVGALPTLDSLQYIKSTLGVHTVLGVSNISFGLPNREKINSAFFTLAMQKGLSAGIVNPLNSAMMDAYYSYNALYAYDKGCLEYISNNPVNSVQADAKPVQKATAQTADDLKTAVIKGMSEKAAEETEKLLKGKQPVEIIDGYLIPALDEVGLQFENKRLFLPQLLIAASAASAAFDVIKKHLSAEGTTQQKGKIILATVKGDIHDIGKNIVKVLLENYGYEIIDLGRDVSAEEIVSSAKENGVTLVGLSALMTTTVPNMAETIELLRKEHDCKVMVGGAVLTQEYSEQIGADFYCKDAMASVRCAEKLFEEGYLK